MLYTLTPRLVYLTQDDTLTIYILFIFFLLYIYFSFLHLFPMYFFDNNKIFSNNNYRVGLDFWCLTLDAIVD